MNDFLHGLTGGAADTHGTGHWKIERVLSVGLLGLFPAAAVAPCQAVDMALAVGWFLSLLTCCPRLRPFQVSVVLVFARPLLHFWPESLHFVRNDVLLFACLFQPSSSLAFLALPIHNHMGMETVLTDYVHGETLPKVAKVANYIVGASTVSHCAQFLFARA